jgi:hypothetical protein
MDAREVSSRADLIAFIESLRVDLRDPTSQWLNVTLDDYLEALEAWVDSMDGFFVSSGEPVPQEASWSLVAGRKDVDCGRVLRVTFAHAERGRWES